MRRGMYLALVLPVLLAFPAGPSKAQDVFVYPREGQSQDQQDLDHFQCINWATEQSGFDPMQTPQATAPPPGEGSTGPGVVGGAAGGAALGAIGGAIAGNTGRGAAIGAVGGGLLGGLRSNRQRDNQARERQQWESQQAAQYQRGRDGFNRAFTGCMEARGYTVS